MTTYTKIDSPVGELTLVGDEGVLTGLYMDGGRHVPPEASFGERDDAGFAEAAEQLGEYFAGERREFTLRTRTAGSEFQRRVWDALTRVPYGQTRSYGALAAEMGLVPQAVRAVGAANGRNPISIVVPCHRVIGADGSLTGYAGGIEHKRFLLDLERPAAMRAATLF
ncbi:methylated-DNA--[protein]-cysteine S-methyltransferase [Georgenia sp. SYP-B2076]|uniref:methylated-DNA--[protein]-cysteine S-methyltransferase n=1 Tax=Georgenia sp. SYP-B2076 TaxID=2495881 RepID=UPI000F8F514C|nr:methylated-DNA--[protein]-cysteine S-methyltransferase [Georgenia sp. SYP-B2076]